MHEISEPYVDEPKKEKLWLACQRCEKSTQHSVLVTVGQSDETPDGDIQFWSDHQTVVCNGCNTVSFCIASYCSESRDFETGEFHVKHRLYPSRVEGRPQMRSVRILPTAIYQIYQETHSAICGDQPILAGIGIRAILDAVCKAKHATGRNLEQQIDSLVTQGFIASEAADFLHRIRSLGNKAAHEVESHTSQELGAAMDIVEQLLQNVFVLPRLAKTLPAAPVCTAGTSKKPTNKTAAKPATKSKKGN